MLERPVTAILASGEPDFPFCLGWANHSWSNIWQGVADRVERLVQPRQLRRSLVRVRRPSRGDEPQRTPGDGVPPRGRVEDGRIRRVRDHDRLTKLDAELDHMLDGFVRVAAALKRG